MIKLSKQIEEAIKEKNVTLVRSSIVTFINEDRRLEKPEVSEYANYVEEALKEEGVELFEEDNNKTVFPEKDKWDKKLWTSMKVKIGHNFSREKFKLILDIMQYLRETGHSDFLPQITEEEVPINESEKNPEKTGTLTPKVKFSIIGAVVGGIIGLGVGTLFGHPLIGGAAGVGILGTVGYSSGKKINDKIKN